MIVAIGDLMIDALAERHPPGVSVQSLGLNLFRGGKAANCISYVNALVGATALIGTAGSDLHGRNYVELLRQRGIDTSQVFLAPFAKTSIASSVEGGQRGFGSPMRSRTRLAVELALLQLHKETNGGVRAVIVNQEVPASAAAAALRCATRHSILSVCNPSPLVGNEFDRLRLDDLSAASLVIMNEDEAAFTLGVRSMEDRDAATAVLAKLKTPLVISRGVHGSDVGMIVNGAVRRCRRAAAPTTVVSTIGAGDALCAGVVASLSASSGSGANFDWRALTAAVDFGSRVAAIAIEHPGAQGAIDAANPRLRALGNELTHTTETPPLGRSGLQPTE